MNMTIKTENIKIKGYRGTWYVIDSHITSQGTVYLLESEQWGDEVEALLVFAGGTVIGETYDDIITACEDYNII